MRGRISSQGVIRALFLTAIALLVSANAARSQYYLGVVQGEAKKIPIAVLDIYSELPASDLRSRALEVLQDDLRRSQIFDVMDAKKLDMIVSGDREPTEEQRKRGRTFGLQGLVWAKIQRSGKNIVLSGKLYDAATGTRLSNKEYVGNEETFRRMVHTFADEIVFRFTGEKGISRSRIAFV